MSLTHITSRPRTCFSTMRSSTLYRHAGGLPGSHPWFLIFRENSWDFLLIYCRASVWHMACFVFYNTENSLLGFVFPFQPSVFAHCNITRNTNNRDERGNTKTGINFPSDKQKPGNFLTSSTPH